MFCKPSKPRIFARVGEPVKVADGLAMTPSQMDVMRRKGMPITLSNLNEQYFDGYDPEHCKFDLPIGETRGVDMAEVWNAQKDARRMMSALQKTAKIDNPQEV